MNAAEKRAAAQRLTDSTRRKAVGALQTAVVKTAWGVQDADQGPGTVYYRLTVNGKPVNKEGALEQGAYRTHGTFCGDEGLLTVWSIIAKLREQAEALGLKLDDSAFLVECQTSASVRTSWAAAEGVVA